MILPIIINPRSGTLKNNTDDYLPMIEQYIQNNFPDIKYKFIFFDHKNSGSIIEQLKGEEFEKIIIGGGDGTINAILNEMRNFNIQYAVLPLGTMNHFAKDNKIPLDLYKSLELALNGAYDLVDIAEVNGKYFVNNSSIGLYPKNVIKRKSLKYSRTITLIFSFIAVFRKFPLYNLIIKINDEYKRVKSPFIFIGNNSYDINLFTLGSRETINDGHLCIYFSKSTSRLSLFKFAINIMLKRIKQDKDFEIHFPKTVTIRSNRRVIDVAADGEVLHLVPPLEYNILPKKLKLINKI